MKSNETQRQWNRAMVGFPRALSCSIDGLVESLIGSILLLTPNYEAKRVQVTLHLALFFMAP